jgi:hypothetical protein
MREQVAFEELLRRHEELTQRFAQLLHDDAGQVLTSIALQLSALEGVAPEELETLSSTLDDLLERFRNAQASLGGAVVAKRGLLAGLSQMARMNGKFRLEGDVSPRWPVEAAQAAFRIVEALAPARAIVNAEGVKLEGAGEVSEYVKALAISGGVLLQGGPQASTVRIYYANSGSHR